MNISEIRKTYPQYNDLSDMDLADKFHGKFYSDIPKDKFYTQLGVNKKSLWDRGIEASGAESDMMGSPANLETLRTVVGGGAAWIPSGIMKFATVGEQGGVSEFGEDLSNKVSEKIVGTPQTDVGKLTQKQISAPFEKLSEKSQEYADIVYDKTGSPLLATATRVAGEAIPFVVPYVAGKGIKGIKGKIVSKEKGVSITPEVSLPKEIIKTKDLPKAEPIAPVEKIEPTQTLQAEKTAETPKVQRVEANAEVTPENPIDGKPAKAAVDINSELIKEGFEGLLDDELAKYTPIQKAEIVSNAKSLVGRPDFFDMAKGKVKIPDGINPQVLFNIAKNEAKKLGDVDTVMELAKSPIAEQRSLYAQKLGASAWEKPEIDPVTAIQDIVKARKDELKRTGEKVDPVKHNVEIEALKAKLAEVQKRLDDYLSSKKGTYGSKNRIVTNDEYLKVKAELREQFSTQLSAGLDPTIAVKLGKIGTYHLEAGARVFAEWSARIVEDVGEQVKPYLEELWKKSNEEVKAARSLKSYKTKLKNEEVKLTEKIENLDLKKINKNKIQLDLEGKKLLDARDRIKIAYEAAVRKTGTVTREEAAQLVELAKTATELKLKRDPNVKTNHGFSSAKERLEYGAAQVAFERYVAKLKEGDQSLATLAKNRVAQFQNTFKENPAKAVKDLGVDTIGEIGDTSISLVATMDNSFIGRQGMWTLMSHPTVWAKAATKSFSDIYKALRDKHGNEIAKDILHADMVSSENYINGNYHNSGILAKFEEQYPTSHPSRIPYIGRAFKASEIAFTNSALRMRLKTFDLLLDMAKKEGLTIDKTLVKDIGDVVNSATARAHTKDSKLVKSILWAPKMMVANINVLTAHGLGSGLKTTFAKKQAAYNLMKAVGETAAVVTVLNALNPNSVELNPTSTDFLKYRDGNTRIDLTAGRGQYLILAARFWTGQTKDAQTKIIKELNMGGLGDNTYFKVGMDFLKNKTSPMARQVINVMEGINFEGKKPTVTSTLIDLTTPIPIKNIIDDSFGDYADDRAIVLLANLADVFGINSTTYQNNKYWDNSNSDEMKALRKRVTPQRFKELNIKYNKTVNAEIAREIKKPSYQRLSDEKKQDRIEKIRRDTKNKII